MVAVGIRVTPAWNTPHSYCSPKSGPGPVYDGGFGPDWRLWIAAALKLHKIRQWVHLRDSVAIIHGAALAVSPRLAVSPCLASHPPHASWQLVQAGTLLPLDDEEEEEEGVMSPPDMETRKQKTQAIPKQPTQARKITSRSPDRWPSVSMTHKRVRETQED